MGLEEPEGGDILGRFQGKQSEKQGHGVENLGPGEPTVKCFVGIQRKAMGQQNFQSKGARKGHCCGEDPEKKSVTAKPQERRTKGAVESEGGKVVVELQRKKTMCKTNRNAVREAQRNWKEAVFTWGSSGK